MTLEFCFLQYLHLSQPMLLLFLERVILSLGNVLLIKYPVLQASYEENLSCDCFVVIRPNESQRCVEVL